MTFSLCLLAALCAVPVPALLFDDARDSCVFQLLACDASWTLPDHAVTVYSLADLSAHHQLDQFCRNYSAYLHCYEQLKQSCTDPYVLKDADSQVSYHTALNDSLCSIEGREVISSSSTCWEKNLTKLNGDCRREKQIMDICVDVQGRKHCKAESVKDCGQRVAALVNSLDDAWHSATCVLSELD